MKTPDDQWRIFLHQCLVRRIDVLEFRDLSELLASRCPVGESTFATVLLQSRTAHVIWDPLLPLYIDSLHRTGKEKTATELESLLKQSSVLDKPRNASSPSPQDEALVEHESQKDKMKKKDEESSSDSTIMTDIKIIQDVILSVSAGHIPVTATDAVKSFMAICEWILAVVAWHKSTVDEQHHREGVLISSPDAISLFESLGIALIVLSGNSKGMEALSSDNSGGKEKYSMVICSCFNY